MNVGIRAHGHLHRFQESARTGSSALRFSATEEPSGPISIVALNAPSQVNVNDSIPISYELSNNKSFFLPTDPNYCVSPDLNDATRYDANLFVDDRRVDKKEGCISPTANASKTIEVQAPPVTGSVEIRLEVRGNANANLFARRTRTVDVVEADQPTGDFCPPGFSLDPATGQCIDQSPDGGNGGDDGGGPQIPNLFGSDAAQTALIALPVTLVLLLELGVFTTASR